MTGKERREQLLDIGRQLFAERGFDGTSIEEIAAQAGVSKPVVYEHFGGKEGLYAVVVDREMERLLTMATRLLSGEDTRAKFEAAAIGLLRYIEDEHRRVPDPGPRLPAGRSGTGTFGSLISEIAGQVEYILRDCARGPRLRPEARPDVRPDAGRHGRLHRPVVAGRAQAEDGGGRRAPGQPGLERPVTSWRPSRASRPRSRARRQRARATTKTRRNGSTVP